MKVIAKEFNALGNSDETTTKSNAVGSIDDDSSFNDDDSVYEGE